MPAKKYGGNIVAMIPLTWKCKQCEQRIIADQVDDMTAKFSSHNCENKWPIELDLSSNTSV